MVATKMVRNMSPIGLTCKGSTEEHAVSLAKRIIVSNNFILLSFLSNPFYFVLPPKQIRFAAKPARSYAIAQELFHPLKPLRLATKPTVMSAVDQETGYRDRSR